MFGHTALYGSFLLASLVVSLLATQPGDTTSAPASAPEPATQSLDERLHFFPIADGLARGAAPSGDDFAALARDKGVSRIVCLLDATELPPDENDLARQAGIQFEHYPIVLNPSAAPATQRLDRAKVRELAKQLATRPAGTTYVHCRDGANRAGAVNFAYRVLVDNWEFAKALQEAIDRGLAPQKVPGFVEDLKLLAAGLDALPPVEGLPISAAELNAPGQMIAVADLTLNVKTLGSGPAVYVLHGGPGETHKLLRPYLDGLAKNHTVVYFDQRGCGASSKPLMPETYTLTKMIKDLEALRAALGHERISLIGHSSGGILALQYALAHPERVDRLVLMSSWACSAEFKPYMSLLPSLLSAEDAARVSAISSAAAAARRRFNNEEVNNVVKIVSPYAFFGVPTATFRADWNSRAEVSALVNDTIGRTCFLDLDLRDELAKLAGKPTLVLAGRFDIITPPSVVRSIADRIPGARFEVFDRSSHFMYIEENERFLALVSAFLAASTP